MGLFDRWRKKKPEIVQELAPRFDAWQNSFTGLGTSRDKVTAGSFFAPFRLQDSELLAMFNGNDLAAKIVETKPKEMMRRGYCLEKLQEDDAKTLESCAQELNVNDLFTQAGMWGGLFGGALLIMGLEDGLQPDMPLNEDAVRKFRFLNLIDRRFIYVHSYYNDPLSPKYGQPEKYLVSNAVSGATMAPAAVVIHESRCIRFDGAATDVLTRQQLAGWTWSLLQRSYDQLRAFEQVYQACANLVSDASQAVFKIENLIHMIAAGEKDVLQQRMQLVDMSRSVCRAVLLDADKETFERQPTTFTGLPDMIDRFMMRLSSACDIPVSILLGRSAAGMNATGESDFRAFYDKIASEQTSVLGPKLKRVYDLIGKAESIDTEDLEIRFYPLQAPTDAEQADVELKVAQKDQIYATIGAASPEQIALSRWGQGNFNGAGMSAFNPDEAENDMAKDRALSHLAATDQVPQGEMQNPATPLPGPGTNTGNASPSGLYDTPMDGTPPKPGPVDKKYQKLLSG